MNNEVLNTPFFSATLRQDGIVCITWIPNIKIGLVVAKESVAAVKTLCQGTPPLLIDIQAIKSIDREARAYYAGPEITDVNAIALLVDFAVSQVIANFYLRINKPTIPTKMFTSEREALKWLQTLT